jgi:alpha-L-fucosidase
VDERKRRRRAALHGRYAHLWHATRDLSVALGPEIPELEVRLHNVFKNQITEVLSYGPAYEIEFDGANSSTLGTFDWKSVFQFVKQAQPNILIWAGPEIAALGATPDLQWIGNENGQASRTTSSLDTIYCGGGKTWCPFECNTSSHRPDWFWHPGSSPMALADMQKVYFQTVGMNCTLIFNVPPSKLGSSTPRISLCCSSLLRGIRPLQDEPPQGTTRNRGLDVVGGGVRGGKATDDDLCTYWAAASGKTSAQLTVTPASPITANVISIREAIELGERVTKYHVEIQQNGTWNTAPTDKSGTRSRAP